MGNHLKRMFMSKGYGKLQLSIIEALKVGDESTLWCPTYQITQALGITRQAAHRALKRLIADGVVYHRYAVLEGVFGDGLSKRVNEYLLVELEEENNEIERSYKQYRADSQAKDEAAAKALNVDLMAYQAGQLVGRFQ